MYSKSWLLPFRFQLSTTSSAIFSRQFHFNPIPCTAEHCGDHPNPEISNFPQKGFSEITTEIAGRAVHTLCIKGLIQFGVFHTNTLVNMYSKFGKIEQAQYVFDKMFDRNEATWNTMMSGYVRVGLYPQAIDLFAEMRHQGIHSSGFVIASLITACNRSTCLVNEGFQIHGFVIKFGLMYDVFVGTSLLHFYGTYGFASCAQRFFEEMTDRNVVSWTSLIVGHSNNGDLGEVISIYGRMRREGINGNQNTFATVITSCGLLEDVLLGHQAFGNVIKAGLDANVSVGNSLISMFGSFCRVEEACYFFDHMIERDTISWNSMISVYAHNSS